MTQVKMQRQAGDMPVTVDLVEAVTPFTYATGGYESAQAACDSLGRLLAVFVESGRFTL